MKKVLLLAVLLFSNAFGEHLYIANTALGTGDGASAANAKAYTFFNTAANWDSLVNTTNGKIGPGDTVHIVNVLAFTGSSPTSLNTLNFQGRGTVGNPITLKFDVGGRITHPTAFFGNDTGLIGGEMVNVIIEGSIVGSAYDGNFIQKDIEVFDNGTLLGNQFIDGTLIRSQDTDNTNITVRNLYMWGPYVRENRNTSDPNESSNSISLKGLNNIVVDNCRVEHSEGGIGLTAFGTHANPSTGHRITNNYLYANATSIKLGAVGGATNEGVVISHNRIDGIGYWSGIPNPNHHHLDGIQTIVASDEGSVNPALNGYIRNITISNNHIGPDLGFYGSMNAHIYLQFNINGAFIYNNLLTAQSTPLNPLEGNRPPGTANGFIEGTTSATPDYSATAAGIRSLVANNTIIGAGSGAGIKTGGICDIVGNIIVGVPSLITVGGLSLPLHASHGPYRVNSNWNIFYNASGQYEFGPVPLICNSLLCWQTHPNVLALNNGAGFDLNSIISNTGANINTGAIPSVTAIVAPTQTIFTDDLVGVTRTVPWDAGAREFVSGADTTAPTPSPMTFSSAPAAVDSFSVTMTASPASDDSGGTLSYFFDETSGAAGGTDSGWLPSRTYVDTGLSPSTLYTYRVKARDPSLNETAYSSAASATTSAPVGGTVNIETLNVGNLRVGQ